MPKYSDIAWDSAGLLLPETTFMSAIPTRLLPKNLQSARRARHVRGMYQGRA
jgi:hypothetical protein